MEEKKIYEELIANDSNSVKVTLPIGIQVEVKTTMTMEEKTAFVDRVAESVFDEFGDYRPEYIEPIFEISLLQMLTDVPVFEDEDGVSIDIDKTFCLCKTIDIRHQIDNVEFNMLVGELRELVYEKIEFEKDRILAGENKRLESVMNEFENGLAMINAIADTLNEKLAEMFKDEEYRSIVSKFNENIENIDEDKIVDSVIKLNDKSNL